VRLDHWREAPCTLAGSPVEGCLRDQMVLRLDADTWLLYATAKRDRCGMVSVFVSENLLEWRFVRYALATTLEAPSNPPWGATESPFVLLRDGHYHLSVTYTTSFRGPEDYHNTLLFRSTNPFDFGTYTGDDEREVFAKLRAHAPEYVLDPESGRWYVTSCGWPGDLFGTAIPGSVAIRELEWS
jgi:beta-fructofuranosidase